MRPSLEHTVFFVVGLKVFIHATGVGHLFAIDLWQELRVLDSLLLVEQDVSRVGVDLLGMHFLVRENGSAVALQSQAVTIQACLSGDVHIGHRGYKRRPALGLKSTPLQHKVFDFPFQPLLVCERGY